MPAERASLTRVLPLTALLALGAGAARAATPAPAPTAPKPAAAVAAPAAEAAPDPELLEFIDEFSGDAGFVDPLSLDGAVNRAAARALDEQIAKRAAADKARSATTAPPQEDDDGR